MANQFTESGIRTLIAFGLLAFTVLTACSKEEEPVKISTVSELREACDGGDIHGRYELAVKYFDGECRSCTPVSQGL